MGVLKENKSRHMSPKIDKVIFSLFLNFSNNLNKTSHIIGIDFCAYLINIPWSHNYDDNYTFVIDICIIFKYIFFYFKEITPKKNNWKREDFRVSAAYAEKTTLLAVKEEPNYEVDSKKHLETNINMNHESKKLFQCDECEMLKEQGLENLAKDFASERDLKSHNSVHHSETALNTDQKIDSIEEFSSFLNTLTSDLELLSKSQQAMNEYTITQFLRIFNQFVIDGKIIRTYLKWSKKIVKIWINRSNFRKF